jgi:hypothetical protein
MKRRHVHRADPRLLDEDFDDSEPPSAVLDEIARRGFFSPPPTVRDSHDNRLGHSKFQHNPFVARYYDARGSPYERRCWQAELLARVRCRPAIEAFRIASLPNRKRFAKLFAAIRERERQR